jgi:hypothetical protein
MTIITAHATSSSRHPHDWGRAVAIALNSLVAQSQHAEINLETSELFGTDLIMRIEPLTITHELDGATITLTWNRPDTADVSAPDS